MPHSFEASASSNSSLGPDGEVAQLRVRGPDGTVKSVLIESSLPPQALVGAAAKEFGIDPATAATTTQLLAGFPPHVLDLAGAASISELPVSARDVITLRVDQEAANAAAAEAEKLLAGTEDGGLVRREMPSDNSCLFRAIAYCVYGQTRRDADVSDLRSLVAETILLNPDVFRSELFGATRMLSFFNS